jgi:phosphoserine phosphatase
LPLLERVKTPIVVNPDTRLRRVAQRRGWPIEIW